MITMDEIEEKLKKNRYTPRPIIYKDYFKNYTNPSNNYKSAVIKNISSLNKVNVKNAMYYILRNSDETFLKNENNENVSIENVMKDWGKNFTNNEKSIEAMHLVFSIDEKKSNDNFIALQKSVEQTLRVMFYSHKYTYVIHKHQEKPHIHVILNKRDIYTNKKLYFEKKSDCRDFFNNLRNEFASNLNFFGKNFNYYNKYKVEKDLSIKIIKDKIRNMTNRNSFFKITDNDIRSLENENRVRLINVKKSLIKDTSKRFTNINNKKDYISNEVSSNLISKIKNLINRAKKLKIKAYNNKYIKDNILGVDMLDIDKNLNQYEFRVKKNILTLNERHRLNILRGDFEVLRDRFDNEFLFKTIENSKKMDFLSSKTNSFEIKKLLNSVEKQAFINIKIFDNNKDKLKLINKNRNFLKDLLIKREFKNSILKDSLDEKLNNYKSKDEKLNIENSLNFLKNEKKLIDELKMNYSFNINKSRLKGLIKSLDDDTKKLNEKSSIFKINGLLQEFYYLDNISKNFKVNNKEINDSLENSKNNLNNLFENRAIKNSNNLIFLEKLSEQNLQKEKLEQIKNTIDFFKLEKKEIDNLKNIYFDININLKNSMKNKNIKYSFSEIAIEKNIILNDLDKNFKNQINLTKNSYLGINEIDINKTPSKNNFKVSRRLKNEKIIPKAGKKEISSKENLNDDSKINNNRNKSNENIEELER